MDVLLIANIEAEERIHITHVKYNYILGRTQGMVVVDGSKIGTYKPGLHAGQACMYQFCSHLLDYPGVAPRVYDVRSHLKWHAGSR